MNIAIHPPDCSESILDGLLLAGATHVAAPELVPEERVINDADILLVELGDQPIRRLREVTRIVEEIGLPVILAISLDQLALVDSTNGISDFITAPVDPLELRLRVQRLSKEEQTDDLVVFKDLELNTLNYQATLASKPIDLTFMEYELLRFLVENPIRVWSREQLLSKVWGYDYYGGARTVDVHIRRLRSKLGEERASWITTVRSVGYRFG
ncbi:MAG TPA: response regulator transcription factor [Acidimicrobiia bacterium]|nr:putative transcriptional regulator [Acidimicrobiia bacterium]HYJ24409.1 response regulator transcription factor [Acidimicrobiia bacterium]